MIAVGSATPWEIYVILGVIFAEALIVPFVAREKWFRFLSEKKKCKKLFVFMWGNLTAIHICWLVVGIMINTLWGFTVLLVISVVISSFVFAIYVFLCSTNAASERASKAPTRADKIRFGIICFISLLSLMSLVVVVVLSGQAFFGRDSANELMKTALLYVTTAFLSWIARKVKEEGDKTTKSRNTTELTGINQGGD